MQRRVLRVARDEERLAAAVVMVSPLGAYGETDMAQGAGRLRFCSLDAVG